MNMYIFVYTYKSIYIYIYVYVYTYIYIYIHIHTFIQFTHVVSLSLVLSLPVSLSLVLSLPLHVSLPPFLPAFLRTASILSMCLCHLSPGKARTWSALPPLICFTRRYRAMISTAAASIFFAPSFVSSLAFSLLSSSHLTLEKRDSFSNLLVTSCGMVAHDAKMPNVWSTSHGMI